MQATDNCAILIDGYSQIFRVFYAIAHLSRQDGFPTNALFGFARLLLQLEKDYAPESGAMFLDCGKPQFRLDLLPEYKSNRPPMPEDLKKQMPLLRELAELFGWTLCECSNYEADDLIGAAVKSQPRRKFAIISSDKDLSQLINENTFMLIPRRTGSGFEVRSIAETIAKFSVTPEQTVDYLAMLGDNSDAIDGVPGVGPKTAAAVLEQCGSLAQFFQSPELIGNVKLREKLLQYRDLLERNIKLITLRSVWPADELVPVEKMLEKRPPDWEKIAGFAREYELKSILRELPDFCGVLTEKSVDAPVEKPKADDLFSWGAAQPVPEKNPEKPEQGVLF